MYAHQCMNRASPAQYDCKRAIAAYVSPLRPDGETAKLRGPLDVTQEDKTVRSQPKTTHLHAETTRIILNLDRHRTHLCRGESVW